MTTTPEQGSTMGGLVERLRGWARNKREDGQGFDAQCFEKAANEIEALREKLEAENFALAAGQCIVEGGLLGDDHGHQYCTILSKLEKAREALEPFAEYADPRKTVPARAEITHGSSMARRQLTMGDCYVAARALKEINDGR